MLGAAQYSDLPLERSIRTTLIIGNHALHNFKWFVAFIKRNISMIKNFFFINSMYSMYLFIYV